MTFTPWNKKSLISLLPTSDLDFSTYRLTDFSTINPDLKTDHLAKTTYINRPLTEA